MFAGASPNVPVTVWVKRMDVAGAQYVDVENVDLEQTVSKFKSRWVAQAKLDVDPSLVSLRLVKCGSRKPSAEEEKQAVELDDPRLSLAEAGITDGYSLLAFIAGASGLQLQLLGLTDNARRHISQPRSVATACFCRGRSILAAASQRHCE